MLPCALMASQVLYSLCQESCAGDYGGQRVLGEDRSSENCEYRDRIDRNFLLHSATPRLIAWSRHQETRLAARAVGRNVPKQNARNSRK